MTAIRQRNDFRIAYFKVDGDGVESRNFDAAANEHSAWLECNVGRIEESTDAAEADIPYSRFERHDPSGIGDAPQQRRRAHIVALMLPALLYGKDIRIAQANRRNAFVDYFAGAGGDELNVPIAWPGNESHIGARKQGTICRLVRRHSDDDEPPSRVGANNLRSKRISVSRDFSRDNLVPGDQRIKHPLDFKP